MVDKPSEPTRQLKKQLSQCQNERTHLRNEITRYQNLVSLVAEHAYELALTSNGALTVRWVSEAFCTLTGYSRDELTQRDGSWHDIAHPAVRNRVREHLSTLRLGRPSSAAYRIVTKDDAVRWISERALPDTADSYAEHSRIYGTVQDITERRAAEERQQGREEYRLRLYHITSATGMPFRAKVRRLLQIGVERLDVENGHLVRIKPEELDLTAEVRSKAELMHPQAQQHGLTIDVETPQHPVKVCLDPTALDRILSNLLDNAIKFTEEGTITIRVKEQADRAILQIQDTGIGIDKEFLPHLFDEFRQESTGQTRSHEGTGLGLAIVKRTTEAMEGSIEVDSQKGEGTTFTLSFPQAT